MPTTEAAGILLAAGGSSRLGSPKQLLTTHGVTLVARAAQQLLDAGCHPVLVVVGANATHIRDAVAMLPVQCVENPQWNQGMGTSIAAAVRVLNATPGHAPSGHGPTAVLIASCDMPSVSTDHLLALLSAPPTDARVASAYNGPDGAEVRGIPARLPHTDFGALAALGGDRGARDLLRHESTRTVALAQGGFDLDTPEDVAAWRAADNVSAAPDP